LDWFLSVWTILSISSQRFFPRRVQTFMRNRPFIRRAIVLAASLAVASAVSSFAQAQGPTGSAPYPPDQPQPAPSASQPISAILDWTPPAVADLTAQASSKTSFAFDRSMLEAMAAIEGGMDPETRQAWAKLDGVSVRLLRFGADGIPNEPAVSAIREAYHTRGLKHLITSTSTGGPIHNGTTDVWIVVDGINVKGAVILGETARSVTLVTVKGDISPADLLHLRGHFGIPKFDSNRPGAPANN
jgi:hypothetical protein